MEAITPIWNALLVWPIEWALLSLTELTRSAGLAIIGFTMIVRTLLLPLGIKQAKSQKAMLALQPQLREIQRRYAGDRAKLGQEQMRLYRENGVNPVGGCLPLVLQMPIWFALYSALLNISSPFVVGPDGTTSGGPALQLSTLWDPVFKEATERFREAFLWIPNLTQPAIPTFEDPRTWPVIILPLLTSLTQWVVQKMSTMPTADPQQQQMNRMMEFMPFMFLIFSFQVASGLVLYWVVSNVYSIGQQYFTVGWGSLPILGASASPVASVADETPGPSTRRAGRTRRKGPGPSARRRRGK